MTKHFQNELGKIRERLLHIGDIVEQSVANAVTAIETRDEKLAGAVIGGDRIIDLQEVELEEECLKALALYQPVAMDLRLIVACLKINNDLERIGDLAVNIAHKVEDLNAFGVLAVDMKTLQKMSGDAQLMLRKSLNALVTLNVDEAREVLRSDDVIDNLNRQMHVQMEALMRQDIDRLRAYQIFVSVSRNLERIGDHATNIAEDVVYLVEGEIVRHGLGRES